MNERILMILVSIMVVLYGLLILFAVVGGFFVLLWLGSQLGIKLGKWLYHKGGE